LSGKGASKTERPDLGTDEELEVKRQTVLGKVT
jgi:hypothetical protein